MSNKTIKINPTLFSLNKKQINKTQKKQKPKIPKSLIKPSKIKHEFLAKIKEHKLRTEFNKNKPTSEPSTQKTVETTKASNNEELNSAINYFSTIVEKKKQKVVNNRVNKTLKKKHQPTTQLVPPVLLGNLPEEVNLKVPESDNSEINLNVNNSEKKNVPQYGCLKKGTLPTFRQFNKTVSKKSNISFKDLSDDDNDDDDYNSGKLKITDVDVKLNIDGDDEIKVRETSVNSIDNPEIIEEEEVEENKPKYIKRVPKKTLKEKLHLGKNDKHKLVGVLIKNNKTRKQVLKETTKLKQKKMRDIKNYLKEHGLLQVGSHASDDLLRTLYENSVLTGKVKNTNSENMIFNYINDNDNDDDKDNNDL